MRLIASIASLAIAAAVTVSAEERSPTQLRIVNVKVFTGELTIDKGVITVAGGKIVSVAAAADGPAGLGLTIDGSGMTALPGLIDAHVHLLGGIGAGEAEALAYMNDGLQETLLAYLRHGVTTVQSLADPLELILQTRRELRRGELAGPRVLGVGPAFTAPGGHPAVTLCRASDWCRAALAYEAGSEGEARREVRRLAELGVDAIKLVNQGDEFLGRTPIAKLEPGVMRAIVAEAHLRGIPVLAHIGDESDALEALAAGVDGLAHPPAGDLVSNDLARALVDGRFVVTTLISRKKQGNAEPQTLLALHRAGIPLVLGSDAFIGSDTSPITSMPPGGSTIMEIEALVEMGLSPEDAIKAATSVAARHLGLADEIGKLEPGMSADILLVRGDPLQTISDLARVEAVIQGGQTVFRAKY